MTQSPDQNRGCFRTFFGAFWRGIDITRRVVVNSLFLLFSLFILSAFFADGTPQVPTGAALVLTPRGAIVDQLSGDPLERSLADMRGLGLAESRLDELIEAVRTARDDGRIRMLVLDLNQFVGSGLSKLQELRVAIEAFKESGKPVFARADFLDRSRYYLAATADEIFFHEAGVLLVTGFSNYQPFFKDGLDRFGIDPNVLRVGEFKSAVEPFLRDDMSPESRQASLGWMEDLWSAYVEDVAAMRDLTPEQVYDFVNRFPEHLVAAGGHSSQAAMTAGLVDLVGSRKVAEERIAEILGHRETEEDFPQIGWRDYLRATEGRRQESPGKDVIALIVGRGNILNGDRSPGTIGSESINGILRQARRRDDIKAVVLRLDSGGGSVLASEMIRQELERIREAGKPVVISMGSVAASGAYWIATASDQIWASPTTITGSIGIFGLFPTIEKPLAEYLGVRVDGVGTSTLAGALRMDREMQPEIREVLRTWLETGYRDFVGLVAEARGKTPEEVDEMARGRVWSGEDALELGLVDRLGGLSQAVAAAAELAELPKGYGVETLEKEPSFRDRLLVDLLAAAAPLRLATAGGGEPSRSPLAAISRLVARQARLLNEFNDPAGLYAHCFCEPE